VNQGLKPEAYSRAARTTAATAAREKVAEAALLREVTVVGLGALVTGVVVEPVGVFMGVVTSMLVLVVLLTSGAGIST
jgi:hypothetical protein